jgi:hypothetical protein
MRGEAVGQRRGPNRTKPMKLPSSVARPRTKSTTTDTTASSLAIGEPVSSATTLIAASQMKNHNSESRRHMGAVYGR